VKLQPVNCREVLHRPIKTARLTRIRLAEGYSQEWWTSNRDPVAQVAYTLDLTNKTAQKVPTLLELARH
jgi:hypothetical protein